MRLIVLDSPSGIVPKSPSSMQIDSKLSPVSRVVFSTRGCDCGKHYSHSLQRSLESPSLAFMDGDAVGLPPLDAHTFLL